MRDPGLRLLRDSLAKLRHSRRLTRVGRIRYRSSVAKAGPRKSKHLGPRYGPPESRAHTHAEIITVEKYLLPDQWNNFFIMVGSGAAALAGLIFVAMSINHEIILRNTTHKNRATNMLTGFTAVFMASSFALMGNQHLGVLGYEWLVLWLIATAIFIRGYVRAIRSGMSSIGLSAPRLAGGTICYLAEVIAAIFLILGYNTGLYIAAIAITILFAFLISGAWLLMIGIYEDRAK